MSTNIQHCSTRIDNDLTLLWNDLTAIQSTSERTFRRTKLKVHQIGALLHRTCEVL